MELVSLLFRDPLTFTLLVIPLIYSIIFHEVAHGWVALRMGDPTAQMLGRLNLSPIKHLDPVGTLMLLIFGFGWAKPVPVNFANIRNQRWGVIFVSSAGIIVNTILAFAAILIYRIVLPQPNEVLFKFLYFMAQINIILAAFNLIPIPPLDGSKILMGFLPAHARRSFLRLEPFGFFIIIGLLYFGLLNPVIDFVRELILLLINLILPV
ncbi:MAG: site-2 protease family protein [Deltaproteobacteria bacterium]|nr:site-2 protease family protein [Deltaproteobacteria bacterium]